MEAVTLTLTKGLLQWGTALLTGTAGRVTHPLRGRPGTPLAARGGSR